MSDREKLIELLRKWKLYFFRCVQCALKDNAHELGTLLGEAADYIEANGVTVQKWIPVSDETTKPKDRRNYFVAYVFGEGTITFYGEEKYHAKGGNGYVQGAHFSNEGMHGMRVTHWMEIPPLPEPPKECE